MFYFSLKLGRGGFNEQHGCAVRQMIWESVLYYRFLMDSQSVRWFFFIFAPQDSNSVFGMWCLGALSRKHTNCASRYFLSIGLLHGIYDLCNCICSLTTFYVPVIHGEDGAWWVILLWFHFKKYCNMNSKQLRTKEKDRLVIIKAVVPYSLYKIRNKYSCAEIHQSFNSQCCILSDVASEILLVATQR